MRVWNFDRKVIALLLVSGSLWACNGENENREFQVRRDVVDIVVAAKGKVETPREVRVTANMMGRIDSILVEEGDQVRQGDLIATMDSDELKARLVQAKSRLEEVRTRLLEVEAGPRTQELEAARARLNEAQAVLDESKTVLDRQRKLLEGGLVSQAQYDEAERRFQVAVAKHRSVQEELSLLRAGTREEVREVALAQVKRAEADVKHVEALMEESKILAPISGQVLWKYMEAGEVIIMQRPQPILTIGDLSQVVVRAEIDESEIQKVQPGLEAMISADAYPGQEFIGKVAQVASSVGRKKIQTESPQEMLDVKVLEATIKLPPGVPLKLGLTVDVRIRVLKKEDVLVVPYSAVREVDGETVVEVKTQESSRRQKIVKGIQDGRYVEVVEGLEEGDVVLLQP